MKSIGLDEDPDHREHFGRREKEKPIEETIISKSFHWDWDAALERLWKKLTRRK